jgi:hypothetical protein
MLGVSIKTIEIFASEFLNGVTAGTFVNRLTEKLAEFAKHAIAGGNDAGFSYYVCSSTLDIPCSGGWFDPAVLCRRVHDSTGLRCSYSNAMQCASWGFLVRHHLTNKPDVRNILLAIVDANPLGVRFWEVNEFWGRTGQRIALVHLQLPERSNDASVSAGRHSDAVVIGKCNPAVMLYDYAREIQKVMAIYPEHTLAIPYFEGKMRKGLKRNIGAYAYLPDLYEEFGHLCGADPWMSIARDRGRMTMEDRRYVVSSIASEGYFCFLPTVADARSQFSIEGGS